MNISGPGITIFSAKIKPDFQPVTKFSFQWAPSSDGGWNAHADRGAAADEYGANSVRIYGKEPLVNAFIDQIELNRVANDANANRITLSAFNATEHIFGADVDYSGAIYATAFMERREQHTWKGWQAPLTLRAMPPLSFTGTAALPLLKHVDVGVDADADREIIKQDTYESTFYYADRQSDAGRFEGTLNLSDAEMKNLRRFAATQRGTAFTIPTIFGVTYPFGTRRGAGPFTVKLKELSDERMFGVSRWLCHIVFVEAF